MCIVIQIRIFQSPLNRIIVFVPNIAVFSEQTCLFEVFVPVFGLFSEQIFPPPRPDITQASRKGAPLVPRMRLKPALRARRCLRYPPLTPSAAPSGGAGGRGSGTGSYKTKTSFYQKAGTHFAVRKGLKPALRARRCLRYPPR